MPDSVHTTIYYDDLSVGQVYHSGSVEVTAKEITTFATRYDPQPFHVDAAAAEKSVFRGLVASGWLTASLTMRLMVTGEMRFGGGVIGLGVESLQWPAPVRPGDVLTADVEIRAMRLSTSKPGFGIVTIRTTTRNQHNTTVQLLVSHVLVPCRPALG
jgi:acyl dehydratase